MKTELFFPTWPNKTGEAFHGEAYLGGFVAGCDSFRIKLRCREFGKDDTASHWASSDTDDWSNVCLHVWHSTHSVQVSVEVTDLGSVNLTKLDRMAKKLRWCEKKLAGLECGDASRLLFTLMDCCARLGIKRCIQYGNGPDKYAPILEALVPIAKQAELRAEGYRQRLELAA